MPDSEFLQKLVDAEDEVVSKIAEIRLELGRMAEFWAAEDAWWETVKHRHENRPAD